MTIRRGTVGSGHSERQTFGWDNRAEAEGDPEIAAILETRKPDGLIAVTEREGFAIMAEAGLPTDHGSFSYNRAGDWKPVSADLFDAGWGIANFIWPVAEARGIEPDSEVGFAYRMLDDVKRFREARDAGEHDQAAMAMSRVVLMREQGRLKFGSDWEKWAVAGQSAARGSDTGAAKRREAFVPRHAAIRADFAERLSRLKDERRAKEATAKHFDITRRHLNRVLGK